ncbi:hypothetical protein [Streptomyces sp. DG1A-41]
MFSLAGSGHSLVWELNAKTVHRMSKQWFKNGRVAGLTTGSCFRSPES